MTAPGAFTKLHLSILDSTIWTEPDPTRICWLTMLALADQYGRVLASVPGLAHRARIPVEATRVALATFQSPDPDSRTPDFEGRRVEVIDGGWRLLNFSKYRLMRSEDDRREQNRLAAQRLRERRKGANQASSEISTRQHASAQSAQAETETEADLSSSSSKKTPACPVRQLIQLFLEADTGLPRPRTEFWSKSKAADAMRARWKWILTERRESGERYATTSDEALAWFKKYFARVAESDFLTGRNGAWTKCDLAWLMQPENFRKVVEGRYSDRETA